jgi:hypothetical protein
MPFEASPLLTLHNSRHPGLLREAHHPAKSVRAESKQAVVIAKLAAGDPLSAACGLKIARLYHGQP